MMAGAAVLAVLLIVAFVAVIRGAAPPVTTVTATPEATDTATPTPNAQSWRLDGVVVDEAGKPVEGVCVGLGPAICTDVNPRTDAKGRWFIDLPKVAVDYDFHFTKPGYKQFDMHVRAVTPQTFQITLTRG